MPNSSPMVFVYPTKPECFGSNHWGIDLFKHGGLPRFRPGVLVVDFIFCRNLSYFYLVSSSSFLTFRSSLTYSSIYLSSCWFFSALAAITCYSCYTIICLICLWHSSNYSCLICNLCDRSWMIRSGVSESTDDICESWTCNRCSTRLNSVLGGWCGFRSSLPNLNLGETKPWSFCPDCLFMLAYES